MRRKAVFPLMPIILGGILRIGNEEKEKSLWAENDCKIN
jgi:hypothetical protein